MSAFACSICKSAKESKEYSGNQLSKNDNKRKCKVCVAALQPSPAAGKRPAEGMPPEPARKRSPPQLQPAIQLQPYEQAEFAGCTTNVPEGERLQRLRDILRQRASARPAGFTAFSSQPDLPSAYGAGSYRKDTAVLTDISAGAAERAALAKQLVDYGEEAQWTKEPRGHSSFWSIVTACRPSGPPLAKDLFALAKPKDRYESLRGVPLEAILLLQHKGLLCRLDILQGNPGMAGPGLWAYRDPPIVKYARAGSQAMVLALLEAGAKVDHCLMWHEETWSGKDYHWRGDSALMAAAREGHDDICRLLLRHGASKNHQCCYDDDMYDKTPSAAARRCGHPETAAVVDGFVA